MAIETTPEAVNYLKKLLDDQGMDDLALRLVVTDPGTPTARCSLSFCEVSSAPTSDLKHALSDELDLYIDGNCIDYLSVASIEYEATETGGRLSIKAPNIKGHAPASDAPLGDQISWMLDAEINPELAAHGGRVSLLGISEQGDVHLQFGGGCHGCGMADVTLKEGIEKRLKQAFPSVRSVLDGTDHASGENPYY